MVFGVEASLWLGGLEPTTDNSPGSAMTDPWCSDGVFAVETTRLRRQKPFPVAKHRAVLVMPEGAALVDQSQNISTLNWELRHRNRGVGGFCICGWAVSGPGRCACCAGQDQKCHRQSAAPATPRIPPHEKTFLELQVPDFVIEALHGLTLNFQDDYFDSCA